MASKNSWTGIGNLGQDPVLRYTTKGTAVCNLSVATNDYWKDAQGNPQERTEWHRVVVFGKQAENCAKYLRQGRQVMVEGRLQTRKWEDKDKQTRYTTEIIARRVDFLGGRRVEAEVEAEAQATEASAATVEDVTPEPTEEAARVFEG